MDVFYWCMYARDLELEDMRGFHRISHFIYTVNIRKILHRHIQLYIATLAKLFDLTTHYFKAIFELVVWSGVEWSSRECNKLSLFGLINL